MDNIRWIKKIILSKHDGDQTNDETAYSSLLNSDDDSRISSFDNEKGTSQPLSVTTQRPLNHLLAIISKSFLVLLALWGIFTIGRTSILRIRAAQRASCSCGGTTVAEAKERGCIFTPMAIAWLPPHCIDMELSDEFDSIGPEGGWPYWRDINGTIPMTREEVGAIADDHTAVFYTTQEWHVMHCMYTWRKHYRSKTTGVTIERRSNGLDHIHHCEGIVRARHPLNEIWTMAGIELNADLA